MSKILPGGRYSAFQPSSQLQHPSYRVPRSILGHDATACCTTYCKLACLVWDTTKGVHGCLVVSPRADVLGEESAGPMEMGAQPDGPAPGREPWGSRWFVPKGKPQLPSVLGSTGWYRFLGASPGWSRALLALLALLVLIGCTPLITFLVQVDAAGGFGCLFPTPLFPFPPVDRCGHTRVPPKSLGVVRVRSAQGSEAKICVPSYAGYPSSPYRCSKRFDM